MIDIRKFTIRYRKPIVRLIKQLSLHWLGFTSVGILLFAVLVLLFSSQPNEVGDFVAGFAGAMAFLWLIASFRMQSKELEMQRKELALQREAINLQTAELNRMAEFSALEHVKMMLDAAEEALAASTGPMKAPYHLEKYTDHILVAWREVMVSEDLEFISHEYNRILEEVVIPAHGFLEEYVDAARFYAKAQGIDIEIEGELLGSPSIYLDDFFNTTPHLARQYDLLKGFSGSYRLMKQHVTEIELAAYSAMSLKHNTAEIHPHVANLLSGKADRKPISTPTITKIYLEKLKHGENSKYDYETADHVI